MVPTTTITKFVLYIATSLDGYLARLDGGIDWLPSVEVEGGESSYETFYASVDGLIMGATTYEQILGFGDWPYPGKPTYVLTRRSLSSDRPDILFLGSDIPAAIQTMQHNGHQRVWLVGGGKLVSAFMQQHRIDEYIITIVPIILGEGRSLYQSVPELKLQLVGAQTLDCGMVELRYQTF